jgi:hypothetical protein
VKVFLSAFLPQMDTEYESGVNIMLGSFKLFLKEMGSNGKVF